LEPIKHSAFAALSIVLSYFEMIARYQNGVTHDRNAGEYFKKGVKSVFPQLNKYPSNNVEKAISYAYKGARCGFYHVGMTAPGIILTRNIDAALAFDSLNRGLAINPHLLVPFLASHFKGYVEQLRDPANTQIRNNFEKRFDYQSGLTL
jgi:hypothetical protein